MDGNVVGRRRKVAGTRFEQGETKEKVQKAKNNERKAPAVEANNQCCAKQSKAPVVKANNWCCAKQSKAHVVKRDNKTR